MSREIVFMDYCYGKSKLVLRSKEGFNTCSNPNCYNCRLLEQLLIQEAHNRFQQ